jgi:hypothetical protein
MTARGGKREYVCRGYLAYGKAYCFKHAVAERPVLDYLIRTLQGAFLDPGNLARLRDDLAARQERERSDGNIRGLKRRATGLEQKITQGNERLVILPADRVPGVVEQLRAWERERDEVLAELRRIEAESPLDGLERAVADAEAVLWRLQAAVREDALPLLRDVLAEMVDHIELHWDREDRGSKTYCRLTRGVVWLRSPEALSKLYPSAAR